MVKRFYLVAALGVALGACAVAFPDYQLVPGLTGAGGTGAGGGTCNAGNPTQSCIACIQALDPTTACITSAAATCGQDASCSMVNGYVQTCAASPSSAGCTSGDCYTCALTKYPAGAAVFANDFVGACGCAAGAPCAGACTTSGSSTSSSTSSSSTSSSSGDPICSNPNGTPSVGCTACLNGLPNTEACIVTATNQCQANAGCTALALCEQGCASQSGAGGGSTSCIASENSSTGGAMTNCANCCASTNAAGVTAYNADIVNACVCAPGAPCAGACAQ